MNFKDKNGILGEAKAASFFVENGFDVFVPIGGKTPFDLAVHRDGVLFRVEVKYSEIKTPTGWRVRIKRSRHNKNENIEYHFDQNSCDLLAVYIGPLDRIITIYPEEIDSLTYFTINNMRV